jgi:endonuclease/exonuclease/phosphatase family metal-dependent hydrolase
MGKLPLFAGALAVFRLVGYLTDPMPPDDRIHQVVGEPSRYVPAPPVGPLRIVSWNIFRGTEFEKIEKTLRRLDADVLILQEVDMFCRRSGNRNVAHALGTSLQMNWVAAGEYQEIGEASNGKLALTGQAILSRHPIVESSVIVFRHQDWFRWRFNPVQPRRGGRIALEARTGGLRVYNTHIESGGGDELRKGQLDEILVEIARIDRAAEPIVIAGDFNNPPPARSTMFNGLRDAGFASALKPNPNTRTSTGNSHPIDWIFTKHLVAEGAYVADPERASDHYPVVAHVRPVPTNN